MRRARDPSNENWVILVLLGALVVMFLVSYYLHVGFTLAIVGLGMYVFRNAK